jgi:predicted nucleotidyltransferase
MSGRNCVFFADLRIPAHLVVTVKQLSTAREAVFQRLRLALPYLRRRYGVVRLSLYGSFARGAAVKDSDVDLLVELSRPLGLEFVSLAQYLERQLGRKVDLVTLETLRQSLTSRRYRAIALSIQKSMADVQEEAR